MYTPLAQLDHVFASLPKADARYIKKLEKMSDKELRKIMRRITRINSKANRIWDWAYATQAART
jgi:cytoplasmic iron level regulating protein YaaA (DUF328/UPF0246 family)